MLSPCSTCGPYFRQLGGRGYELSPLATSEFPPPSPRRPRKTGVSTLVRSSEARLRVKARPSEIRPRSRNSATMPRRSSDPEPAGSPGHPSPRSGAADGGTLLARAIAGAKQGDVSALHFLYVRYADDVQGYVESIVRDRHEAEDITQNVFAKLLSAIARYEQREVPFAAWLLRIARTAALDYLRDRRRVPSRRAG